jgi:hypothetical protein
MSIELKKPYKIIERKFKTYEAHYHIPSVKCVIVPIKEYGDDLSCDVRWEDDEGIMHTQSQLFFSQSNIEPVDALKDFKLHEIWQHYYE